MLKGSLKMWTTSHLNWHLFDYNWLIPLFILHQTLVLHRNVRLPIKQCALLQIIVCYSCCIFSLYVYSPQDILQYWTIKLLKEITTVCTIAISLVNYIEVEFQSTSTGMQCMMGYHFGRASALPLVLASNYLGIFRLVN